MHIRQVHIEQQHIGYIKLEPGQQSIAGSILCRYGYTGHGLQHCGQSVAYHRVIICNRYPYIHLQGLK